MGTRCWMLSHDLRRSLLHDLWSSTFRRSSVLFILRSWLVDRPRVSYLAEGSITMKQIRRTWVSNDRRSQGEIRQITSFGSYKETIENLILQDSVFLFVNSGTKYVPLVFL